MKMYEELKAWANKWGVKYKEGTPDKSFGCNVIEFESITYDDAAFSYNPETGDYVWYGGQ